MKNVIIITILTLFVAIKGQNNTVTADNFDIKGYSQHLKERDTILLLARLVYSESPHEIYKGKLAVANVVINRKIYSGKSIKAVIYQKGQFDGVNSKRFKHVQKGDQRAFNECLLAAEEVYYGKRILPKTVMFFHNPKSSTDTKWVKKILRFKYRQIGNHLFCHRPK